MLKTVYVYVFCIYICNLIFRQLAQHNQDIEELALGLCTLWDLALGVHERVKEGERVDGCDAACSECFYSTFKFKTCLFDFAFDAPNSNMPAQVPKPIPVRVITIMAVHVGKYSP